MEPFRMPDILFVRREGESTAETITRSELNHVRRMAIIYAPMPWRLSIANSVTNVVPAVPWAGIQTGDRFRLCTDAVVGEPARGRRRLPLAQDQ